MKLKLAAANRDEVAEGYLKLTLLVAFAVQVLFNHYLLIAPYQSLFHTPFFSPIPILIMIRTLIPRGASRSAIRPIQPNGFCLYTSRRRGYATEAGEKCESSVFGAH